jgi:glycosyltransferase involved in cell wall biosynthesis
MKIAITGTRGIPNHYGGFEQLAEYLSEGLAKKGHEVFVYNSHNHPYQDKIWRGVQIIHRYDAEEKLGTFGQFIYDFNCLTDCRKHHFDVILQLGYTSSSVWGWLLPRKPVVISNMDGLEWKRSKYSRPVQEFLKYAEKWAVQTSDFMVADSLGIQKYLREKYKRDSFFIAYGAYPFLSPNLEALTSFDLKPYSYNMLMARMEPENNIEIILDGVVASEVQEPFLVIGKYEATKFGRYLKEKFTDKRIRFLGGIYDIHLLNNLRYYCNLYFHGHSVGGTNPSLLEAMASQALLCVHDNDFNRSIVETEGLYFTDADSVKKNLESIKLRNEKTEYQVFIDKNSDKIHRLYTWKKIIDEYEQMMLTCFQEKNVRL